MRARRPDVCRGAFASSGAPAAPARSNGGAPGICMTAFRLYTTRVASHTPSTILYTTQAPRATAPEPPGLRGLHGPRRGLRPPARAALRAAGAHLRGSGALSGPGAAAVATRATCQKKRPRRKHGELARGIVRRRRTGTTIV